MVKWEIAAPKTALLIIDMNNNFLKGGMPFEIPSGREIIPNLKELIEVCRSLKIPIIYFTQVYRRDGSNVGLAPALSNLDLPPKGEVACDGTGGIEIYDELKPEEKDIIIKKPRYDGFYFTDLESVLRGLGVDTLIITGVVTDCCINFTAASAFQRGFKVIVVSDCTAARDKETQEITLKTEARLIGEVATHSEIIDRLRNHHLK